MRVIVILGPTGVGKSKLSIELAKKMNAEIINADATQVYKEVNIGVAKVTKEEMKGIPHHMIDIVSVNDEYTVADYQRDARAILDELIIKNKNVIIVGGSGLYIKALLYDYKFTEEREKKTYDNLSNEELKIKVDKIYPNNNIHINNRKRLERFLSHYEVTGEIIKNTTDKDKPLYNFTLIGLTTDRENLYETINKRVDIMLCDGLIEETRNLYNDGFKKIKNFIGYKELIDYFEKRINIFEAMDEIKKNTRKYSKRQYTFFKNQFDNIKWFMVDYSNFNTTIKKVEDYLNSF